MVTQFEGRESDRHQGFFLLRFDYLATLEMLKQVRPELPTFKEGVA